MHHPNKLIAFFNAYSHGKAGGDSVFIEIAKRLTDFEITVITSELGKTFCQQAGLQADYRITSNESTFTKVISTYLKRTWKAFFFNLDLHPNDILLGTSDFFPDVLPIYWLRLGNQKLKWIQHVFHLIPSSRKIPYVTQKISLFLIKHLADAIVVDNHILKEELLRIGFDAKKIFVNYPGIDLPYLHSISKDSKTIYDGVCMAQIRPSKGILELIDIWKFVCDEKPGAKLAIIGKGQKEVVDEIREKIKRLDLDSHIKLLGFLADDAAFSLIKNSQVFLFPSHEEGFGISPLQAQALGLPVVAWNLPVFAEVFPKGMIQVPIGDSKTFAGEVINLLKNKQVYKKLSEEAVNNAAQYDWDRTAQREVSFIKMM